jgi:hypothetical protein
VLKKFEDAHGHPATLEGYALRLAAIALTLRFAFFWCEFALLREAVEPQWPRTRRERALKV